ncbi:hypothetical protein EYC59_00210 [Candidatus Saccharibacteria bacterium]|nr:MAG: hypothetical protein EYC59_00210 [Candidatus Saccharibacteria bacterium]
MTIDELGTFRVKAPDTRSSKLLVKLDIDIEDVDRARHGLIRRMFGSFDRVDRSRLRVNDGNIVIFVSRRRVRNDQLDDWFSRYVANMFSALRLEASNAPEIVPTSQRDESPRTVRRSRKKGQPRRNDAAKPVKTRTRATSHH